MGEGGSEPGTGLFIGRVVGAIHSNLVHYLLFRSCGTVELIACFRALSLTLESTEFYSGHPVTGIYLLHTPSYCPSVWASSTSTPRHHKRRANERIRFRKEKVFYYNTYFRPFIQSTRPPTHPTTTTENRFRTIHIIPSD